MTTLSSPARRSGIQDADWVVERDHQIVVLTRQGIAAPDIAVRLGISIRTVQRVRTRRDCRRSDPAAPLSADEQRRALQMLDDGCSYNEVGRTLGRSYTTIRRHFPGRGWSTERMIEHASAFRTMAWLMRKKVTS